MRPSPVGGDVGGAPARSVQVCVALVAAAALLSGCGSVDPGLQPRPAPGTPVVQPGIDAGRQPAVDEPAGLVSPPAGG